MKSQPLISVVLPVRNGEKYLQKAIESVLAQTYKHFELIIINDCSLDNTSTIIKKYKALDKRIRLISLRKHSGEAASRNIGIKSARGEFIASFDADDINSADRLQTELNSFKGDPSLVIVGSSVKLLEENSKVIGKRNYPLTDSEIRRAILFKNPFAHPSVMISRNVLYKSGLYDEKLKAACDYDLWFRVIKFGRAANLKKSLVFYRFHDSQQKVTQLKETLLCTLSIQRKYIFKKNFSIKAIFYHFLLHIILVMPKKMILLLFRLTQYNLNHKA